MSYKIETHDYDVRLKNAKKFVSQGHRVGGRSEPRVVWALLMKAVHFSCAFFLAIFFF